MAQEERTEKEIIIGLLNGDEGLIYDFFYNKCRPILNKIRWDFFSNSIEYPEMANSFYLYLSKEDADGTPWAKLRKFQYRSTLFTWIKVVAVRYFMEMKRKTYAEPINVVTHIPEYSETRITAAIDMKSLLNEIPNDRYRLVLDSLLLQDRAPEEVARDLGITVDNLYNIKRRALNQLVQLVRKEGAHV